MGQTNACSPRSSRDCSAPTVQSAADSPLSRWSRGPARGRTYVFAINTMESPNQGADPRPALVDGPVTVVGEQRTVTAKDHFLIDHFGGLQVNVYVQSR